MSELFQKPSQEETLQRIQQRLDQGAAPAAIIEEMMPKSRDGAVFWGRRLTGWEEYRDQYPDQVIALARVISRRAMQQYRLMLREDGRVVERRAEGKGWKTPLPAAAFPLMVAGEEVHVTYTRDYFPYSDTGLMYFVSPHEPPEAHPLSDTGHYSRFVPNDVVEACGGPHAYAVLLADACLHGREEEFMQAFEGIPPAAEPKHRRPANLPTAATGGHTGRLLADEEKPRTPPHQQGMLF
jgi:hypothetical protein